MIKSYLPKWGRFGEFLSILPIPEDYFDKEVPDEYEDLNQGNCNTQTDGKDSLCDTKRQDDGKRRRFHSDKMKADAVRWINWSSGIGLSFEHTKAVGGRCSERELVRQHGSLGRKKSQMEEWKDYYLAREENRMKDMWMPGDLLRTTKEVLAEIDNPLLQNPNWINNRHRPQTELKNKWMLNVLEWGEKRLSSVAASSTLKEEIPKDENGSLYTDSSINDPSELQKINDEMTSRSPQSSPGDFLDQLELLERLHRRFESKHLSKNILSAYLHMTSEYRLDLLCHMGSPLASSHNQNGRALPNVWHRLAKIPKHICMLADKGFAKTDRFYPFLVRIKTPPVMRGRHVKQHTTAELNDKAELCRLRYTCEVVFSRVVILDSMKDIIPYHNMHAIPAAVEWGHAQSNLLLPLRLPGRNSGLPSDYWNK